MMTVNYTDMYKAISYEGEAFMNYDGYNHKELFWSVEGILERIMIIDQTDLCRRQTESCRLLVA